MCTSTAYVLFYKKKETCIQTVLANEHKNESDESDVDAQSVKSCVISDTIHTIGNPASMPSADPELGNSKSTFISRTKRKLESCMHLYVMVVIGIE